jgi:hypothetical protein
MAFIDSFTSSSVPTGVSGNGGAPTGSGAVGNLGNGLASPISAPSPGSNGAGSNVSQVHYVIVFILVDIALLLLMGYLFNRKGKSVL